MACNYPTRKHDTRLTTLRRSGHTQQQVVPNLVNSRTQAISRGDNWVIENVLLRSTVLDADLKTIPVF